VEIVSPDTLVIAEEFSEWEDSRIDLPKPKPAALKKLLADLETRLPALMKLDRRSSL
jgi:hypothetical protein